jgi:hypothetical protein
MTTRCLSVLPLLVCLFLPTLCRAGDADSTAQVYRIILKDGSIIVCTITSSTPDSLFVLSGNGIPIALPRSAVKNTLRLRGTIENGEFVRADPNSSRLLLGPTARPLRGGNGYVAAYEIFFAYGAVGLTDFLSLGGGLTLFPGASGQVFYFTPKLAFTLPDERFSLGAGALYMNTTFGSAEGLRIVYGAGTFGSPRAALTIGTGYGYVGGEFSDNPVILIGGEVQVSNNIKFLSENWFPVNSHVSLLSLGIRIFGDNLAGDFGFYYPLYQGSGIPSGFPLIPWLGIVYNFGH